MERIELELDEKTLTQARELAAARHCSLSELVKDFIEQGTKPATVVDTVLGMFADEAELLDAVVDSAMRARERDPLRQRRGIPWPKIAPRFGPGSAGPEGAKPQA